MREDITADRIANSILQRRKNHASFFVVEGSNDRLFLSKFSEENTQIEISFGWEKLLKIIDILNSRGFDNVIGIIDKDFREILSEETNLNENIIVTDNHDLDIMCINKSFPIIFNSYCSDGKVETFKCKKNVESILDYSYDLIKPLSFLKIINKREKLNLVFKTNDSKKNRFDYTKFIDKNKFELISIDKMVETIINFSHGKTKGKFISNDEIIKKLNYIIDNESFVNIELHNGHDFGEVICIGLRKVLGTTDVTSETFLKECILNYESTDFVLTEMYKDIKNLENDKNVKFLKV